MTFRVFVGAAESRGRLLDYYGNRKSANAPILEEN